MGIFQSIWIQQKHNNYIPMVTLMLSFFTNNLTIAPIYEHINQREWVSLLNTNGVSEKIWNFISHMHIANHLLVDSKNWKHIHIYLIPWLLPFVFKHTHGAPNKKLPLCLRSKQYSPLSFEQLSSLSTWIVTRWSMVFLKTTLSANLLSFFSIHGLEIYLATI